MNFKVKKKLLSNEGILLLTIILISIIIGVINPTFFTAGNWISLIRSCVVTGIFAIGTMIIMVSGGVDVSFTAIAALSMYVSTKILIYYNYQGSILLGFVIAGLLGILMGLINAFFVAQFNFTTFIVTLGTSNMIIGFLLTFIGFKPIDDLPVGMVNFAKLNIFTAKGSNGTTFGLPAAFLILLIVVIISILILKYTMLGRGIYAIGGDKVSAERAGFNVKAIQYFIYAFSGFLAGIGGITHTALLRSCSPTDLPGTEMMVIAAVVLGGTRLSGGHGSIIGTLLGVLLMTIITNSLILLGLPSYSQAFMTGLLILVGTGLTIYQSKKVHDLSV